MEPTAPQQLPCPNCGDDAEGNYCRNCGQKKSQHRASVRILLRDALEDQFSLTVELPRTLRALFARPGFLTTEYSAGRIARYIPPFRLYLIASLLFFVCLSIRMKAFAPSPGVPVGANADSVQAQRDTFALRVERARDSLRAVPDSILDNSQRCMRDGRGRPRFCTQIRALNEFMAPRILHLDNIPETELMPRMMDFLIRRAPTVLFILLPIFALLLKVLYWRSRKFYAEHFVFALHVHSFAAMVLAFMVLPLHAIAVALGHDGRPIRDFEFVTLLLGLWIALYLLLAMKRVSGQGWIRTIVKFVTLSGVYIILCSAALMIELMVAMIMV